MRRTIAKNKISLKFANKRVPNMISQGFSYKDRRNEVKKEKERSASRKHSGVKRSLYRRIRMERDRSSAAVNKSCVQSVQISLTNEGKTEAGILERPFDTTIANLSFERATIHKNDFKRLEEKIKQLDREIKETENKRKEINRCHSISTHETELEDDSSTMKTPVQGRKSMPVCGVRNTLGHIRGILTHMVDLVNRDPNINANLSSELSSLVKFKSELKNDQETPDVIKSIKTFIDKTPSILDSVYTAQAPEEDTKWKKAQSKYEDKRVTNHYPRRRKVWKEDIEYYSSMTNNSLFSKEASHKRQKTVDSPRYMSFSEQEPSPLNFKIQKQKKESPSVNPFYTPSTLKSFA